MKQAPYDVELDLACLHDGHFYVAETDKGAYFALSPAQNESDHLYMQCKVVKDLQDATILDSNGWRTLATYFVLHVYLEDDHKLLKFQTVRKEQRH